MGLITPASSPSLNAYCPLSTLGDRPLTIPSTPLPSSRLSFFCCVARGRNCVTTKIAQASEWTVRRWDVRRRAQFLPLSNRFASCSCTTAAPAPPPHRLPSRKISLRRRQKKPKRHRSVRPCPGTARPFFFFFTSTRGCGHLAASSPSFSALFLFLPSAPVLLWHPFSYSALYVSTCAPLHLPATQLAPVYIPFPLRPV